MQLYEKLEKAHQLPHCLVYITISSIRRQYWSRSVNRSPVWTNFKVILDLWLNYKSKIVHLLYVDLFQFGFYSQYIHYHLTKKLTINYFVIHSRIPIENFHNKIPTTKNLCSINRRIGKHHKILTIVLRTDHHNVTIVLVHLHASLDCGYTSTESIIWSHNYI